ncbi:MAG: BlaI/MecI/CopY family transcriptional regulator [Bacteroidia bacterium]|nr:BlaI/MecI/CopY family transcriptional regulator [Bacteroidia bacterium]
MDSPLLTPQELNIMNILWSLDKGFVNDILDRWTAEPKPAYNTVSTIVRILETKGFVSHEAFGRSHRYFPVVTKRQYQFRALRNMVDQVFGGSSPVMVARLLEDETLSENEMSELKKLLNNHEEP